MKRPALFLLSTILILNSCYQPEGEHFVNIKKPDGSGITIDLDNVRDTVFIDQNTSFKFTYNGPTIPDGYNVYVDDKLYNSFDNQYNEYSFYIDANSIGIGSHTLKLQVTAKSNSHSLADILNAEKIIVSKQWVLVVDKQQPEQRVVTLDTTQGTVIIKWNPYTKWNFKYYRISIRCPSGGSGDCKSIEITDPNVTTWTDNDFIGGEVGYQVDVITTSQQVDSEVIWLRSKAGTAIELLDSKTIRFRWTNFTFYKNIKSVKILQQYQVVKTISDLSDTTLITENNFKFGTPYAHAFEIYTEGKTGTINRQLVQYALGKLIDNNFNYSVSSVTYNKYLDQYYIQSYKNQVPYFTVYDKDFHPLAEKQYDVGALAISTNGQFMYTYLMESPGKEKNYIHQMDPHSLDTTRTFSPARRNYRGHFSDKFEVSNTNLLLYNYVEKVENHLISQMPKGKNISQINSDGRFAMSQDGRYYFDSGNLYEIVDNKALLINKISMPKGALYAIFRADTPYELLLVAFDGTIRLIRVPELTTRYLKINTAYTFGDITYDSQSGWLLWSTDTQNNLLNINTGESLSVPLVEYYGSVVLANSKIISQMGYVADIDFIKSLPK